MRQSRSVHALLALVLLVPVLATAPAAAEHTPEPTSVAVPGSFNDEVGCSGDWQPECADVELTANDDGVWRGDFPIPAGDYEYKAALDDSWDENYGAGGVQNGANIALNLAADMDVRFYYSHQSHWITDSVNSLIASAPGSYQSEIGCPGDWQPECLRSWLQDLDGDGVYTLTARGIPEGDYAFKVALDETWDVNYGDGGVQGGADITFTVANPGSTVIFSFDSTTNVPSVTVEGGLEPGDELLVGEPARPAQDDVTYFVLPDRFDNGDPANDEGGDVSGDPLVNGFLPEDKGYYHGGDIAGLMGRLDYLDGLGVTAIWMTPQFTNRWVQGNGTVEGSSAAYHGYWQVDYTQIDPHFGTNDEMVALVDAAHALGMDVYFDVVLNHTGDVISYEEGVFTYRNKTDYPYVDADGNVFDDRDYAGGDTFPPLDAATSFPYTPTFAPGDDSVKNPDWLNDPVYYHNRGDSTFTGENSLYGDFFGLDDLFTEHPTVVDGMIRIHQDMITNFGIDGFRVDTVKHVNDEFWEQWVPAILAHAAAQGKSDFALFGEIFGETAEFRGRYMKEIGFPAVLDFGFDGAAKSFAASSTATDGLASFFAEDDYFTDTDSSASYLRKFIGNHDIGRFGWSIDGSNPGAADDERVARVVLGQALNFLTRGQPIVYYGDEQGFTGDGGDKDARQDMMPSLVAGYNDDDLIGTDATTADINFDETHVLYQAMADLAAVRAAHVALQRGAQITRFSEGDAGMFAFSRIDRDERVEYVVALNNSSAEDTATFVTATPDASWTEVYPDPTGTLSSGSGGAVTVTIPALGVVVYRADVALPAPAELPYVLIAGPGEGEAVAGNVEVVADVDAPGYVEVSFAVSVDGGDYVPLGTDDAPPYRVFYDVGEVATGTPVTFKAVVADTAGRLNADIVNVAVGEEVEPPPATSAQYAIIHYLRTDGDYGDETTGDYNDFWGLHLWGDIEETIDWTAPKPFLGEDEYGRFAWVKLAAGATNVGFIVHRGDTKDGTDADRFFDPSADPEIWLRQDDATTYTSQAAAQGYATVHYHRDDGDYGDPTSDDFNDFWGLHLWGDAIDPGEGTDWTAPKKATGEDEFGIYWDVPLADASLPLNFIIHRGDAKDPGPDQSFIPTDDASVWITSGDETIYGQRGAAEQVVTIHYHRPDGDYGDATSDDYQDFWGLHTWNAADDPGWTTPRKPTATDKFGISWDVPITDPANDLGYIIHRGDEKDPGPDQFLDRDTWGFEVWQLSGADPENPYILPILGGPGNAGDLTKQQAHWVADDTIVWPAAEDASAKYELWWSPDGTLELLDDGTVTGGTSIPLTLDGTYPAGIDGMLHLGGLPQLRLGTADLTLVPDMLRAQVAVVATSTDGVRFAATGLQIPGVLDDRYAYDGDLGVRWDGATPVIELWAPTARSVKLHLFADSDPTTGSTVMDMVRDDATGVWSLTGDPTWKGWYYLYEVDVWAPSTMAFETNLVTDPYSVSLATNSARTQIVNLWDGSVAPDGWSALAKPSLAAPEDVVIYELHVRDFSVDDTSVPEDYRGTYKAFTVNDSDGMEHLEALADAGLTHLHLLPVFDIATIDETKANWQSPDPDVLATYPPDSEEQQAAVAATADLDGFNWGYDPWHYTTPEGSYSTDPDGVTRILEFREMVQALDETGLRVVMDVVYNHTNASGQADKSVLDRIVPGYYHRLDDSGVVATSTCCANTATEHAMMEKLMIDSLVTWAKAYKVDGFRFDLMGHHSLANMQHVRAALDALTLEDDGVDGASIYLYGEGWNFGEVADDARFIQATQLNMAGTGIGTFNDRIRDAIRGGGPFDGGDSLVLNQGYVNGAWYDPNELVVANAVPEQQQLDELLLSADQIRVGLAGNLADYELVDRFGNLVPGSAVDYNGAPTGYTGDPQEQIAYASAHDNQTLFDVSQYHHPLALSMADRVRAQNVAMDVTALSQGVPFFHAGVDMLRSKSFDRDSYNSGDWFNSLDFSYETTNYGVGLPVADKNEGDWYLIGPRLADPALTPAMGDVGAAAAHLQEILEVRKSTPLFRLPTAAEIEARLAFHNTGPDQIPGVIVMSISDTVGADLDPNADAVWTVINPTDEAVLYAADSLIGEEIVLHPVLAGSVDPVVQSASFDATTGAFSVPARTTAVFIELGPDVTPPEASAELVLVSGNGVGRSVYQVGASCTDDRDPAPAATADINGAPVVDGQEVVFVPSRNQRWEYVDGELTVYAKRFVLTVTCTDATGNNGTATAVVRLGSGRPR